MKSKKELNALKKEVETVNKKLAELSDEELEQVTGGEIHISYVIDDDPVGSAQHTCGVNKAATTPLDQFTEAAK